MSIEEKRKHRRLQLAIRAEVTGPEGFATGELRDISAGGAAVILSSVVGKTGNEVMLRVPYSASSEMLAHGIIVRVESATDGFIHGIRFNEVKAEFITQFMALSDFLPDSEKPRQRRHPRIAWKTPIQFGLSSEKSGMSVMFG